MSLGTWFGFIGGFAMVIGSIITATDRPMAFIDIPSIIVVVGGTIMACFISYEMKTALSAFKTIGRAFKKYKDIDSKNFTAVSGSTVVTLKQAYLNTLDEGNHTLTFVYTDGTIDTTLKVAKANTTTEEPTNITTDTNMTDTVTNTDTTTTSSSPKTGDNIIIWISLFLISALGVIGTIRFIKKRY